MPQPSKPPLSPKEFHILFLEEAPGEGQTLDLSLEVKKHLGNSVLEDAGKCLQKCKSLGKTELETRGLALTDPITGPIVRFWESGQIQILS